LENGERLTQPEFHRRYLEYPEDVKFELIGGIVYMASPLRIKHSYFSEELGHLLGIYRQKTPGVEALQNATTILGELSEPQPDLGLFIRRDFGGQSQINSTDYLVGPPELLAEIAYSSRAIDMTAKRIDYEKAGVIEYIVLCIEEPELHWFHFPSGRRIRADEGGISRSRIFPGLWIDGPALLERKSRQLAKVLRLGLASPEYERFVKRLRRSHQRRPRA
jgi:Uma2 family endonuclease